MNVIPMTVNGFKKLQDELEHLKKIRRPEIIRLLSEARKHGDLKENSEYNAAREQQWFCENKIKEIQIKLSKAQIIDITKIMKDIKVIFGSTVSIRNLFNKKKYTYKIVGDDEANYKIGLIAISSPIARGLIGKNQGDEVVINTPKGNINCKIIKVDYL